MVQITLGSREYCLTVFIFILFLFDTISSIPSNVCHLLYPAVSGDQKQPGKVTMVGESAYLS